jgi:phosphatidylglycerol---prolipoprotein diacylglyceryl transferase
MWLAFYVHHLDPFIIRFTDQVGIRWYGTAYLCGFLAAFFLLKWLARKNYGPLKENQVADLVTLVAIFGVLIGGRLGYILFYKPQMFLEPLSIFQVWDGGMASHGGILGVIIVTFVYAYKHKIPWSGLGDNIVAVAPLGLFFGRIANFINGELYGRAATVPWAMQFPNELMDGGNELRTAIEECIKINPNLNSAEAIINASRTNPAVREVLSHILTPRYPSQLFEAALEGLLLFTCLFLIRLRFRQPNGVTTGCFFILYPIVRILCEYFREPDFGVSYIGPFTRGQFLSLFMFLVGVAFLWNAWRTRNRENKG